MNETEVSCTHSWLKSNMQIRRKITNIRWSSKSQQSSNTFIFMLLEITEQEHTAQRNLSSTVDVPKTDVASCLAPEFWWQVRSAVTKLNG